MTSRKKFKLNKIIRPLNAGLQYKNVVLEIVSSEMAESFHPEGIGYAFHADSSVCLVKDGVLVAVAEEERFRRIKHWAGFSSEAIRYCLQAAGIGIDKVEHVSVNQDSQCSFNAAFLLRLRLQSAILRIGQFEELLR